MTIWSVVSQDRNEVITGVYQMLAKPSPNVQRIYFQGLLADALYKVVDTETTYLGYELMEMGLILDSFFTGIFSEVEMKLETACGFGTGDFTSKIITLIVVN